MKRILFIKVDRSSSAIIPLATRNAFMNPVNAYNATNALKLINTQYWVGTN